ncbi:MAG: hypothetical protein COA97_02035 [Flavobacteriales bacterium]|nr:MAG: hypothetical protein COA97_02035 [Flavobacteriales bacterium]
MKNIVLIVCIALFGINANAQKKEKTYKVLTACGKCQFDMNSPNGCALAIKIADKNYWVDGSSISDHGNEHATDGLCQTVRKAKIQGTFEGKRFTSTSFVLLSEKQKKKK